MMFRGGDTFEQPEIAWRRPSLIEAFLAGCCVFTLSMVLRVIWDAATSDVINYAGAFFHASCFGGGYGVGGLLFKSRMVVLR